MSRDKSQGIVLSFYHAIHATRLVQMPLKKEEVLPFSFAATRRRKHDAFPSKFLAQCELNDILGFFRLVAANEIFVARNYNPAFPTTEKAGRSQ